ncbi:MAG: hypothetical protein KJ964_02555 [Verrucomicrobia bacterium]|nr:hypothetical protein [Verrucomicrobiota bacterium]MBU1734009.1 hypothetical protein [Verrucomicrobiota bacterium]MBU1857105.1 hypothetical protein [Verrucomicrobiota bacterium]
MNKHSILFAKSLIATSVLVNLVFLNVHYASAQSDVTNEVQVLCKIAFMGKSVSNELVKISTNENIALDLRQYAANVVTNHNMAGTNSYGTLEAFITGWSITNEPTITSNLIATMKQTLEYGISGKVQLNAYVANTNISAQLRQIAEKMLANLWGEN